MLSTANGSTYMVRAERLSAVAAESAHDLSLFFMSQVQVPLSSSPTCTSVLSYAEDLVQRPSKCTACS